MTCTHIEPRCLFILKRREDYGTDLKHFNYPSVASGMFNSASFVANMLTSLGIPAEVNVVIDNNCIDAAVTKFKPTHVFIEGYWVVPTKFTILKKLHPAVTWVVRCHSELPFLAQEGIAISWTTAYLKAGVVVAPNSPRMKHEFEALYKRPFTLLPNFYPIEQFKIRPLGFENVINISCFGAIRPMKNHLNQAIAAIAFADANDLKLCFHVNAGRIEMNGANSIKNLKAIFDARPDHTLIEHFWTSHEDFLEILSEIDLSMQVSFTESFNIVTADALSVGTPVLTSSEVPFLYPLYADPVDTKGMTRLIGKVLANQNFLIKASKARLKQYDKASATCWLAFLEQLQLTPCQKQTLEQTLVAEQPSIFHKLKSWFC